MTQLNSRAKIRSVPLTSLTAMAFAFMMVLAACGSGASNPASTPSKPQRGGDLIFSHAIDIKTLDPVQAVETETIYPIDMMFETLTETAPNGQSVVPWLASSWDLSADQLTWTFHLRAGVQFSDGTPMTSADVKFSLDRNRNFSGGFSFLDAAIKDITTPDPETVVITTKYPWKPLLADLALWANGIYPNNFEGKTATTFFNAPIGTGPFALAFWNKGVSTKMVRNPHYWQPGKPYLNSVTWTFVPDDNTRILQLKGGQIQIDSFPPFATLNSLKVSSGITVQTFPSNLVSYVLENEHMAQFKDVHVRRAIAYAIDDASMNKAALYGYGKTNCSYMAPTLSYYDPQTPFLTYNLSMAKQELAMSAYPNGFTTSMLIGSTDVYQEAVGTIVQQELKAININVTLDKIDPGQLYAILSQEKYGLAYEAWASDIPDPDEQASFMLDPVGGGADSYSTGYNNPQVVQLVHQTEKAFVEAQRASLYTQIQVQVAQDAP